MKTIIVPTDFSATSVNAAHYAADMAGAIHTDILLAHVASFPIAISEIYVSPDAFDITMNEAKEDIQQLKEELIRYSNSMVNISVIVTMGGLLENIQNLVAQTDTFAVIMGTQGSGASERLLLGSNALAAMHKLSVPVIIVPRQAQFKNIVKIGLACDMKDVIETIPIRNIEKLAILFSCTFDILYVTKSDENRSTEVLSGSALFQNLPAKFHFIINENVETGISEFIDSENIDLLLVVPKEHGFPGSVFHKSISKEMALQLNIPVMAVHK